MGTVTKGAAVVGPVVVAYGLGYLFTYALSITAVRESSVARIAEAFGDGGAAWKIVGVVYPVAFGSVSAAVAASLSGDETRREAAA